MNMEYRRLGRSGLQVSVFSLGSWVSFGEQFGVAEATDCLGAAYEAGVNFFDNAESYAGGESERIMGVGDRQAGLGAPLLRDLHEGVLGPARRTQHEEHAEPQVPHAGDRRFAGTARSRLRRPAVLPPRRPEHADRGDGVGDVRHRRERRAHYWGTSEWTADEIRAAWDIADKHHLHKPVMEQPQYNLFARAGSSSSTSASTKTSVSVSPRTARSRRAC